MSDLAKIFMAASVALWTASPLVAQDQAETPAADAASEAETPPADATSGEEAAPEDLSMGEPAEGENRVGQTYVAEVFGDWQMRCVRTGEDRDPCQLYQLLQDSDGNSVAEISLAPLPPGQQAAAGATVITPLETLLTAQVTLSVDGSNARRYPFTWCSAIGCFSRIGFTGPEVDQFKAGREALIEIRPVAAPDQTVSLPVSLTGFTAGFEAVQENNQAG